MTGCQTRQWCRTSAATLAVTLFLGMSPFATTVSADEPFQVLAKAEPDEWFTGLGNPYVPYTGQISDSTETGALGQPKVNQTYLWGMTCTATDVWFGTGANIVQQTIAETDGLTGEVPEPNISSEEVFVTVDGLEVSLGEWCWAASEYASNTYPGGLDGVFGDWRPPKMYRYRIPGSFPAGDSPDESAVIEITPNHALVQQTIGIRSAGVHNGVVFMAGPSTAAFGINMFAFRASDGAFLGAQRMTKYSDIRSWASIRGSLYTVVLNTIVGGGGSVLKWTGSVSNPFSFLVVGELDNEGAYLCEHDGRIAVTTWPTVAPILFPLGGSSANAGVWLSPPIPTRGLQRWHRFSWSKIFDFADYDPDPIIASSYSGGPICSFQGDLYWTSIHLIGGSTAALFQEYGQAVLDNSSTNSQSFRLTSMFRRNDSGADDVELLYGSSSLGVYTPDLGWASQATGLGAPTMGPSGYTPSGSPTGRSDNAYTWQMLVHNGQLYFTTFDFQFFGDGAEYLAWVERGSDPADDLYESDFPDLGADLWCLASKDAPGAFPITLTGGGNATNHGFRTACSNGTDLFLGTANLANLLTTGHAADVNLPKGGWELLRYVP